MGTFGLSSRFDQLKGAEGDWEDGRSTRRGAGDRGVPGSGTSPPLTVWFMASNPGVAVKIRVYASHSLAPNLQGDVRLLKKFSHYG